MLRALRRRTRSPFPRRVIVPYQPLGKSRASVPARIRHARRDCSCARLPQKARSSVLPGAVRLRTSMLTPEAPHRMGRHSRGTRRGRPGRVLYNRRARAESQVLPKLRVLCADFA